MKRTTRTLALLFLGTAGLLVASMVGTYFVGHQVLQAYRTLGSQRSALQHLNQTLSTLTEAETGQRGFLLTGQAPYLEPYRQALQRLGGEQAALHQLAGTGELRATNVEQLDSLIQEKLAELQHTIQLRRTNPGAALAVVETNQGRSLMERIRSLAGEMAALEEHEYREALGRVRRATLERTGAFVLVGVVNVAFLGWAYRRMVREIRQREAAAVQLAEQKELLSTTLASIGDGVIVTDPQGQVTFLNAEAERLTGWTSAAARGQALSEVFRIINESTREPVEDPVAKVLRLGTVVGLANHTLLLARDGRETPIDDSAAPIRHGSGPLLGVVLVFRDFSEQKAAQQALEQSNRSLKQFQAELEDLVAERTARLTEMVNELQHVSYALVHDMRAPLRAMTGFADTLVESLDGSEPGEQVREYCRRIRTGASRLDQLITDSLSYTRAVLLEVPMSPVALGPLVRELLETYPNLHPEKADITLEGDLPVVLGNASLLVQCFSNLLGNAVKFVPPGTRPRVRVRAEQVRRGESGGPNDSSPAPKPHPPLRTPPSAAVRVWVEDNGIGIPAQAQRRLFGMFQKLDNQFEGTGIGLALVRKVVERMGGKVGAESQPGEGSRFWVELPVAERLATEQ